MTLPETVSEYSQYAAQEFLQTVVFVDDRIYERKSGSVHQPKIVAAPKKRKKVVKTSETKSPEPALNDISDELDEYSPHDVVTSFAKKQIICSLYQPNKGAKVSPTSDIFPLCRAADIVIVDWDLYGDRGERALELIDGLINQAVKDVPEQLRLILVYTQELNLFSIADQLYQKISLSLGDKIVPVQEEGGLAFHTANSRVSILGKTGRERADTHPDHIVEERELANVAVKEFAKLASGLLHAATLLGLSEIKKNSRKILSKFNSTLDPAFLTHMAMHPPEEDASSHIIPLIILEIEAILEDALPNPLITENLLRDWCNNVWNPGGHINNLLGQEGLDVRTIGETVCLRGFAAARQQFNQLPRLSSNANIRKASKLFLKSDEDNSNHVFSHLMASRTFYGDMPKTLKLGSIVYKKSEERYLLCIQPVCDSVRLEKDRKFVFVELIESDPESGNQASHIVSKEDGKIVELFYQAKSYQCYVAEFSPDPHSKQVITKQSRTGEAVFVDKSRKTYVWLDQLKTSHAQRAVENYASDLSRVGLTESEWLRLLGKK